MLCGCEHALYLRTGASTQFMSEVPSVCAGGARKAPSAHTDSCAFFFNVTEKNSVPPMAISASHRARFPDEAAYAPAAAVATTTPTSVGNFIWFPARVLTVCNKQNQRLRLRKHTTFYCKRTAAKTQLQRGV